YRRTAAACDRSPPGLDRSSLPLNVQTPFPFSARKSKAAFRKRSLHLSVSLIDLGKNSEVAGSIYHRKQLFEQVGCETSTAKRGHYPHKTNRQLSIVQHRENKPTLLVVRTERYEPPRGVMRRQCHCLQR